jgi:hypothetical protein
MYQGRLPTIEGPDEECPLLCGGPVTIHLPKTFSNLYTSFTTAHHLSVALGAYMDKNWRLNLALASKMTNENGLL